MLRPLIAFFVLAAAARAEVRILGELKQWHKVTVQLAGPTVRETDTAPNPFTDFRFEVTFTHTSGQLRYTVPGYFAADGDAANTSATSGNVWRAHFAPDRTGEWSYRVTFTHGPLAAVNDGGVPVAPFDGKIGSFTIAPTDKGGRDFRAKGRLEYVGRHHLSRNDSVETEPPIGN